MSTRSECHGEIPEEECGEKHGHEPGPAHGWWNRGRRRCWFGAWSSWCCCRRFGRRRRREKRWEDDIKEQGVGWTPRETSSHEGGEGCREDHVSRQEGVNESADGQKILDQEGSSQEIGWQAEEMISASWVSGVMANITQSGHTLKLQIRRHPQFELVPIVGHRNAWVPNFGQPGRGVGL